MDFTALYSAGAGLLLLAVLEIILSVDNAVFLAIIAARLPAAQQMKARMCGLSIAVVLRILMLLGAAWIIKLKDPLLEVSGLLISGKDILMLGGGLFLIAKTTLDIHESVTVHANPKEEKPFSAGQFWSVVVQIGFIDLIFSLDSVLTAIGLSRDIGVIIGAMILGIIALLLSAEKISEMIAKFPGIKMLALSFVLMVGILLVGEGIHIEVPRGYIYFAMAFSVMVEVLAGMAERKERLNSEK